MDAAELASLYTRYGYGVLRRCCAYLGAEDATEAMVAVFERAVRGLGPERGGADPLTWLSRIADALCEERLLERARALGQVERAAGDTEASGFVSTAPSERARAVPPAASGAALTALERAVGDDDRDALFAVQRLLPELEPAARRLAVLYFLDELSEEQLAHELGWSRRTVSKRLSSLLERARALWSERAAS